MGKRRGAAVLLLVAVTLACSDDAATRGADGTTTEAPGGGDLALAVRPHAALADEPVEVTIDGAADPVAVTVTSTDDAGRSWSATDDGVHPDDATQAVADLMTTLTADDGEGGFYRWGREPSTFTVEAGGAQTTIERSLIADDVEDRPTTLDEEGFVGQLWTPAAAPVEPGAAIVLIAGSGGGYGGFWEGPLLAAHGIPALQLGLFGLPGLPEDLREIPIETVETALRWLAQQPGVDPEQVWVLGTSRGSEAALLAGSHAPDLVAGVVATVPSSVVNCAFPDCDASAWTLGGQPLPYVARLDDVPEAAAIPVERIDGPVITTCGEQDAIWSSCSYVEEIEDRRGAAAAGDPSFQGSQAGHGVGTIAPGAVMASEGDVLGGTQLADEQVRREVWPVVLEALGAEP